MMENPVILSMSWASNLADELLPCVSYSMLYHISYHFLSPNKYGVNCDVIEVLKYDVIVM